MQTTQIEVERLSEVIGVIYEGATDPARWDRDILPAMADYLHCPFAALFTAGTRLQDGGFCFYRGDLRQDQIDRFMSQYLPTIPWVEPAARKGLIRSGNVILGEELLPAEEWLSSRLFVECFDRLREMEQMMTGIVFGLEAADASGTVLACYRSLDHPAFGPGDRARMQLLLPHVSRSLGVMQRLRAAELTMATTLAALDRLAAAVLLFDAGGHVGFANRAASRLLERADGLCLRQRPGVSGLGQIDASQASSQHAIQAALQTTLSRDPFETQHFSQSVRVPRPSGLGHYTLQFSALGNQNEFGGAGSGYSAIAFIADSEHKPSIDPLSLQAAYGLTPAEAAVAITLLEYESAKDAAKILGSSPNTVRAQLQQIYAKLGVDNRTRFVKVMLGLASQRA